MSVCTCSPDPDDTCENCRLRAEVDRLSPSTLPDSVQSSLSKRYNDLKNGSSWSLDVPASFQRANLDVYLAGFAEAMHTLGLKI